MIVEQPGGETMPDSCPNLHCSWEGWAPRSISCTLALSTFPRLMVQPGSPWPAEKLVDFSCGTYTESIEVCGKGEGVQ